MFGVVFGVVRRFLFIQAVAFRILWVLGELGRAGGNYTGNSSLNFFIFSFFNQVP